MNHKALLVMDADQTSELEMIGKGKTVCEWAIDYMERLNG